MCLLILYDLFFFFSSRRRHTRSKRDWSSDVCSSDLWDICIHIREFPEKVSRKLDKESEFAAYGSGMHCGQQYTSGTGPRSEERRVGKECRSRWSPEQ